MEATLEKGKSFCLVRCLKLFVLDNRPFTYSAKEPGSSVIFLYIFIHEIRSSGVRASLAIVHIQTFYKM